MPFPTQISSTDYPDWSVHNRLRSENTDYVKNASRLLFFIRINAQGIHNEVRDTIKETNPIPEKLDEYVKECLKLTHDFDGPLTKLGQKQAEEVKDFFTNHFETSSAIPPTSSQAP